MGAAPALDHGRVLLHRRPPMGASVVRHGVIDAAGQAHRSPWKGVGIPRDRRRDGGGSMQGSRGMAVLIPWDVCRDPTGSRGRSRWMAAPRPGDARADPRASTRPSRGSARRYPSSTPRTPHDGLPKHRRALSTSCQEARSRATYSSERDDSVDVAQRCASERVSPMPPSEPSARRVSIYEGGELVAPRPGSQDSMRRPSPRGDAHPPGACASRPCRDVTNDETTIDLPRRSGRRRPP